MGDTEIYDLIIKDTSVLMEQGVIRKHCTIAIKEGLICKIYLEDNQKGLELILAKAGSVIDGKNKLWMPGLIDGHMHTGQQLLRGKVLDELPMIWTRIMLPFESTMTPEKMRLSARLASLEMIKSGTTGFIDAGSYYMEEAAKVYAQSGLRGILSCSSMDQGKFPDSIKRNAAETLKETDTLYDAWHGKGNLKVYYSLRALMNCSQELIESSFARARERKTFLQAHMNEYAGEVNYTLEKFQMRPMEYLNSLKLLGPDFVAAHCLMLSPQEMELMAEHEVKVVHCPFSNCGKGVPNTPELHQRGIRTALGTDGAAHGGLSLWNEMKIFRSVMNVTWGVRTANPAIMPAGKILSMATEHGAALMGEAGQTGVIREGAKADLISIDLHSPHMLATGNLLHTLLESAGAEDVRDMIVQGRFIMKEREVLTLDEEAILAEAEQYFVENNA